jgi:hypothetical protein
MMDVMRARQLLRLQELGLRQCFADYRAPSPRFCPPASSVLRLRVWRGRKKHGGDFYNMANGAELNVWRVKREHCAPNSIFAMINKYFDLTI